MIACFYMESFAIACERARLSRLEGMPIALTSEDESTIAVPSVEAIRCGVRPGMAVSAARALVGSDLVVLPYDRPCYLEAAEVVWNVYAVESDRIEPVSPEVCYVDLDGPNVPRRVQWLSEQVAPRIGCALRVGVGRSKAVALEAARQSGSDRLIVPVGDEMRVMGRLPIADIAAIERKTAERLKKLGIVTLADVARLPAGKVPKDLKRILPALNVLAHGADFDPVRSLWPLPSIDVTVNFDMDETVAREERVSCELRTLAGRIAAKLSATTDFCREVHLLIELEDGSYLCERERRPAPTSHAGAIHSAALRLLDRAGVNQPIRGFTLTASGLGSGTGVQLALLDEGTSHDDGMTPRERKERLASVLRHIRAKFGVRAIITGALLRQARKVNLWTFCYGHLLDEPIRVATSVTGAPVRYWRRQRAKPYRVTSIHDRWREHRWFGDRIGDRTAWRVETDPSGISELHAMGVEWRLTGVFD